MKDLTKILEKAEKKYIKKTAFVGDDRLNTIQQNLDFWFYFIKKSYSAGRKDIKVKIKTKLLGRIARGWCHKKTEHLIMNPDLVIEIEKEIVNLIK